MEVDESAAGGVAGAVDAESVQLNGHIPNSCLQNSERFMVTSRAHILSATGTRVCVAWFGGHLRLWLGRYV